MLRNILLPTILLVLTYGFWVSSELNLIAAGVAIFLFGMFSLEEGFKAFTGGALERLLRRTTDRLWKSLSFGIVTTTLMQSSSLVSVITISFLSAGLIGLSEGIGIIFGANLGTTTGAWLVAGFGLKVKISEYAMPLLVFGVILMFQRSRGIKGIGYILAGIGFLFLGIHYMKEGFDAFKETIDLAAYAMPGYRGLFLFVLLGIIATVIMQSSHATLVLILTALAAHQITYENGLALAIGSNIGTTITAIIGSMSANVEGRRLAGAHLVFNLVTGVVAIAAIHLLVPAVDWISHGVGIAADDYTLKLAVFHTLFNLLGIILMVPLIGQLVHLLQRLLVEPEPDVEKPIYLMQASAEIPAVALEAVRKETLRVHANAMDIMVDALNLKPELLFSDVPIHEVTGRSSQVFTHNLDELYERRVKSLYSAIVDFVSRAQGRIEGPLAEEMFRTRQAGRDIVEALKGLKHLQKNMKAYLGSNYESIRTEYEGIRERIARVLRELERLQRDEEGRDVTFLSLDQVRVMLEKGDVIATGRLDELIRERRITPQMATSLINDSGYCYEVCGNLIASAKVLFASRNPAENLIEREIALTPAEITQVVEVVKQHEP